MNRSQSLQRVDGTAGGAAFAGRAHAEADGVTASRLRVGQSVALEEISGDTETRLQRNFSSAVQQANRSGGPYAPISPAFVESANRGPAEGAK